MLAQAGAVPTPLWAWISKRGDYLREPTVEEQYDALFKFFTGHSLKEEPTLWTAFRNLKTARNTFVHGGAAKIGGIPVSLETAGKLVLSANAKQVHDYRIPTAASPQEAYYSERCGPWRAQKRLRDHVTFFKTSTRMLCLNRASAA